MKSDFCDKIQRKCTRELCSEARGRIWASDKTKVFNNDYETYTYKPPKEKEQNENELKQKKKKDSIKQTQFNNNKSQPQDSQFQQQASQFQQHQSMHQIDNMASSQFVQNQNYNYQTNIPVNMCRNIQNINSFINNQQQQQHHQFNQFDQQNKISLSLTSNLISSSCNLMNDDENTMEFN